jgi:hypothetical protein
MDSIILRGIEEAYNLAFVGISQYSENVFHSTHLFFSICSHINFQKRARKILISLFFGPQALHYTSLIMKILAVVNLRVSIA